MRVLVLAIALVSSGCAAIPLALGVDAVIGGVGVYQRWEDRGVQREQTDEIRKLREEIQKLREALPPR